MDVVIVGGGVIGSALAATLTEYEEVDVVLLEKNDLGSGTTAASAAVFTWQQWNPNDFDHAFRRLAWRTYEPLIAEETISYEQVGLLAVAESAPYAEHLQNVVGTLREYGFDASWVDAEGLSDYGLDPTNLEGGLHTPEEGYFDTEELVEHFAGEARKRGADVRTETEVIDVLVEGGGVRGVDTTDGAFVADAVVNAAGPWAPAICGMVGVAAPLRHTFGPIRVVEGRGHDLPFALFESKRYLRPAGNRRAYVGKYLTDYGDGSRYDADDPPTVDDAFQEEVAELLGESVPALSDISTVDDWVGLRTVTPDGRPLVGESDVDGFYLAVGMTGLGVTLAPAVADLLVADLLGEWGADGDVDLNPETALSRLAPGRF